MSWNPGQLVRVRERDWVVQPSIDEDLLLIKPLGGSEDEMTGIYLPLGVEEDVPQPATFPHPEAEDIGSITKARLLHDAARLSFRNGAGPFRCLAKLSFRPRSYQMVPLIMALKQEVTRMLIADDVGVGKTIEALLIVKELLERRAITRFAIVCLPHLCNQWQKEIREKIGMEAVIIRSNTQARLDREIQGDASVYQFYPFQIISVDYIKSDQRREVFRAEAPEMIVVDEAHSCARPQGASKSQQQRHALIADLAEREGQHLVLLTATPHSGKPEEFQSLLGLLKPHFAELDVATAAQKERRELAAHLVQRKRGDVEKWMGEDTPFPKRDAGELDYDLSPNYQKFFDGVYDFARSLVEGEGKKRVHYWTALGLLRGVMSSPAAGVNMLRERRRKLNVDEVTLDEEEDANPVHDIEMGFEADVTPDEVMEVQDWTEGQLRKLRFFEKELSSLSNPADDRKLATTAEQVKQWLKVGYHPVVFCRYIATAKYVGDQLSKLLKGPVKGLDLQVITSEDPDEVRAERIEAMEGVGKKRVLVATDCLSEGINLHEYFTAVLHYDLPWNPNRLEQREGRIDRFGQLAPEVKALLLFSKDNPVDGVVLDVILRKVREIKRATGINVPFPEDSKSVIDAITKSLLLSAERKISARRVKNQTEFDFGEVPEAKEIELRISDSYKRSEEREKASRAIFAQHAIKAHEIEEDLRETDEAIGDPAAVEAFVVESLRAIFGVQIDEEKKGYRVYKANLPAATAGMLPDKDSLLISFKSPTPEGYAYVGRNHPFVEQLCQLVMADTIARRTYRASRAAAVRCREVESKTTLFLFRCRNVIEEKKKKHELVAEEMLVWGYRNSPKDGDILGPDEAKKLLAAVKPTDDLTPERRERLLEDEIGWLEDLRPSFDDLAEIRCKALVDAHERFSALMDKKRYQVVYPVLPMDALGIYVLLPC